MSEMFPYSPVMAAAPAGPNLIRYGIKLKSTRRWKAAFCKEGKGVTNRLIEGVLLLWRARDAHCGEESHKRDAVESVLMIEKVWVWGLCHGCLVHVMLTGRGLFTSSPLLPPPYAWQRSVQSVGKGGPGTRQIRSHNELTGPLQGVPRMLSEANRLPLARREGPPGPGHTRTYTGSLL